MTMKWLDRSPLAILAALTLSAACGHDDDDHGHGHDGPCGEIDEACAEVDEGPLGDPDIHECHIDYGHSTDEAACEEHKERCLELCAAAAGE